VSNDDTLTTRLAGGHEVPLTGHHTPRASTCAAPSPSHTKTVGPRPARVKFSCARLRPNRLPSSAVVRFTLTRSRARPDSDLDAAGLAHPLNAGAGVLPTGRRVRSAHHFPVAGLVGESVADLKLDRQDATLGVAAGSLFFSGFGLAITSTRRSFKV
jgi:hypothetical protein